MGGANSLLSCTGHKRKRRRKKKKHKEDIAGRHGDVETLKVKATQLKDRLSQHDADFVEERVRTTERKYTELLATAERKQEQYGMLGGNLDDIRDEANRYLTWLKEKQTTITEEEGDTGARLKHLEHLCIELESRTETLSTITGKSASLVEDLPVAERDAVEQLVASVQSEHDKTYNLISQQAELLRGRLSKRQEFSSAVDKLISWVEEREKTAERNVSYRLLAVDVDKQADKCKSLCSEVQSHMIHLEPIREQIESLKAESDQEMVNTLENTMQTLTTRYDALTKHLQQQQDTLHLVAGSRRQFEADCQKIERWCEDTEMQTSTEIPLDCAAVVLQEQVNTFKILKESSEEYSNLLNTTIQQGEGFFTNLVETDRPILEKQLEALRERFTPVMAILTERVQTLELAVKNQSEAETSINETENWLKTLQVELQQVTLGVSVDDAEDARIRYQELELKLAQYKPTVTKLSESVTQLRTSGQTSQAETISHVSSQYELLIDQISQHQNRCQQALNLRQLFLTHISELEETVRVCQDQVTAMSELGTDVTTRVDKYREIKDKLVNLESEMFIARDRAQQIAIDSSEGDGAQSKQRVETLREKVKTLVQNVDERTRQCEQLMQEREDFEDVIGTTISWLEQKEDILASRGSLDLDSIKIDPVLSKHESMSSEALEKLHLVREKAESEKKHYEELQEPVPVSISEKLAQISSLEESIKSAIEQKEEYLLEARADREQLENSMHQVTEWLHGAEDMLDSGYDGLDYDTIASTLSEYTDYFSEASLCQDEMEQAMELSEKMLPTLDANDKTTLQQSLGNTNKKLSTIITAAQKKQEQLEGKVNEWKVFQVSHQEMHQQLEELESQQATLDKSPIINPQDLQLALDNTKKIQTTMEAQVRNSVDEINEQARSLDRVANSNSRAVINQHVSSVNARWNSLVTQTEARLLNLQETASAWSEYNVDVEWMEDSLHNLQEKLDSAHRDRDSADINTYISSLQELSMSLSSVETKMEVIQRSNATLQKSLPTAEARVSSQNTMLSLQERLERLRDTVRDDLTTAQESQEDQQAYLTELTHTITWFIETRDELAALEAGPEHTRSAESIERYKTLQQEIRIRTQKFHHFMQVQEAKYSTQGKQLPESLRMEITRMSEVEASLNQTLQEKEEELLHLRADREEYQNELDIVTRWLTRADVCLREQIHNIQDSKQEHETLLGEFPEFQTHLDRLRSTGGSLIQHTPDPAEKTRIQSSLVEVNRQFSAIQSRSVDRTKQLEEASRLATSCAESAASLDTWLGQAETITGAELSWADFDTVREELKTFQKLSQEVDNSQDRIRSLHVTLKQLGQFSDTTAPTKQVDTMAQRVARVAVTVQDRLSSLEDTHAQIEEYETNIADITRWLEQTRGQLAARDPPLDTRAQLNASERLVQELQSQRNRAQGILQRYEKLRSMADVSSPSAGTKLMTDIAQVEEAASEQCEQLRAIVMEQESNDEEIRQLNVAIGQAQEQLLASPVMASSVNTLKQQIAEHDTLAARIQSYQARLSQINEKNLELSERSLQRSPTLVRKRFLMNTSGGSSGFSSANFRDRSSPYSQYSSSGTHLGYNDSIEDSGAHMSDFSLNTMPSSLSWSTLSDRSDRTSTTIRPRPKSKDTLDSMRSQSLTSLGTDRTRPGGNALSPFRPPQGGSDADKVAPSSVAQPYKPARLPPSNVEQSARVMSNVAKGRSLSPFTASRDSVTKPLLTDMRSRRGYTPPRMRSLSPQTSSSSPLSVDSSLGVVPAPPISRRAVQQRRVPGVQDQTDQLSELNTSWASLQNQVVTREKELHEALHKQENYQRAVQEVTAKMERAQKKLSSRPISPSQDLERQQQDYKDTLADIDRIKEDITSVKEQSRTLLDRTDPEGGKAMDATLSMLNDRLTNLQSLAADSGKRLQDAKKDREKHNIVLEAYKKRVGDIDAWLSDAKVRHSVSGLPTDSVQDLQSQMTSTKDIQEDLNTRLQMMSDLAVQCDRVCEHESPTTAEKLRTQLASLQKQLGDMKLEAIDKQSQLRGAIKESDKRQREMADYEGNVQKLQQWISDTKQMTLPSVRGDVTMQLPEQQRLQKDLTSGLSEHQRLVRQISVTGGRHRDGAAERSEQVVPSVGELELKLKWEELQRDLAQKKQDLEELIKTKKPAMVSYHLPTGVDPSQNLEEIRQIVVDLGECWEQLQGQVEDRQVRVEQALSFQQQYQQALHTISSWLDSAQLRLLTSDPAQSTQQQLTENEKLKKEIQSLQREITTMSEQAQNLLKTTNQESHGLIQQSLTNLNERVSLLESQAHSRGRELEEFDSHVKQYQEEVDSLQRQLVDTQHLVHTAPSTAASSEDLLGNVQEMETQLHRCEGKLDSLKKRESELSSLYPQSAFPSDLNNLQTNFMSLQRKVTERRSDVLQLASGQEQYEKLLQDYAQFMEVAQGKLRSEDISASDLTHLRHQLASHKDFFSDLEVHKAMLDSLASQCPASVRDKHQAQHNHLSNETHVMIDKASLHGQRLERLVSQWGDLDAKLTRLQGSLSSIENQIPGPIASGDSLDTIQDKLAVYQRLQRDLAEEKLWVFEVVDKGKQLLHSLTCPELETAIARLADKWVDLNTCLTQDLKRTETLGDQLQTFEAEAAILNSWLTTARMKLSSLRQLSDKDRQSMAAVRAKVEKLLEFQKEVENQIPLRSKVLNVGRQLMVSSSFNTTGLDKRLKGFETEWASLQEDITATAELLHQAQMDLMPSRQALHELGDWLDLIKTHLREDKTKPVHSVSDIEVMLKKYKGYKIELNSKQLTVDFVNQQVLQPHVPEDDREKLDFAEKLGEFNRHWRSVSSEVNDRLKTLERLMTKYEEYEWALTKLQAWFREQEDKIKTYRLAGHEVGVKQTLKECKDLMKQLKAKESEIAAVKTLADSLIELSADSPGCQRGVQESIDALNKQWLHLEEQLLQLDNVLEDMTGQWGRYSSQLNALKSVLTNTEYSLNRYSLVGGDINSLTDQVKKLKTLEAELRHHEAQRDALISLGEQLTQVCDPAIAAEIAKNTEEVQNKWRRLSADLSTRRKQFEQCLKRWQQYESEYHSIRSWLDNREKTCHDLALKRDDPAARSQCLQESKNLQEELDNIQTRVSDLCKLSDELAKNMDPSTIVLMTSRHSGLEQRLLGLRQVLAQNIESLQEDLSSLGAFRDAFEVVRVFLNHAESVLDQADPSKSSDEQDLRNRMSQLKDLQLKFTNNSSKLDRLNIMGYKLALGDMDANKLRDLNHRWHRLYSNCGERCKTLQANMLVQQDFSSKCDSWMTFLAQTEQDLSVDIAGDHAGLLDQQRKCQKFESEMYSRQQVLHAIIADGGKMLESGEVDDPAEFQEKLHLLAEQWRSVVRRATQRKAIIDRALQQWSNFDTLSEELRAWLADKDRAMKVFEFDTASLQQINNMLERVKTTQREFRLQEDSFKRIHEVGNMMLQRAEGPASEEIKVCLAQLDDSWYQSYNRLDQHRERLENILRQWHECEDDIDDILAWLRETRQILAADLPSEYDNLQADVTSCKDISTSFANSEDRRQQLLAREKQLSRVIRSEDLNILHQRIRLLNKQWDELAGQTVIREQRVREAMCHWAQFAERVRDFIEWIEDMEVTVTSSRETHVEELLHRLETDIQEELMSRERDKNHLVEQGRRLMRVSSDIRASDIDHRIERLEDRWQHLQSVVSFRQRKLQETVLAVRQLEVSMRNLSRWLSEMEEELSGSIVYTNCDQQEVQDKLQRQQELQRDIERHSAGVASVLNLCEVLLHDSDACPSDVEYNSLQHTRKTLDQRWRNICKLSPERRARIEESWQLWEVFMSDCKIFSDWLIDVETEVGTYNVEDVSVEITKEEIRKYETLQRNVHDHLGELENINKQYRRLAKEGRTDTSGSLRATMQDVNDRWDHLQQRVTTIMKSLRHSASIRTDFNTTRTSLMNWLTDMEMQLANIQHSPDIDSSTRLMQLQRLQDEIEERRARFDYLDQSAVYLMQKGEADEVTQVQSELEEVRRYWRRVVESITIYHTEVTHITTTTTETRWLEETSQQFSSEEELRQRELKGSTATLEWDATELEAYLESSPPESPPHKRRAEGKTMPRSSVSPTRLRTQETSAATSTTPREEQRKKMKSELGKKGKTAKFDSLLNKLGDAIEDTAGKLVAAERVVSLGGDGSSLHSHRSECERAIENLKRLEKRLKSETGQSKMNYIDNQIRSVVQRWEILQLRMTEREYKVSSERQDLAQFRVDLDNMLAWLDEAEALQTAQQPLPGDMAELDNIIRQYKDFLVQLESKKARVLSINLISKNYIDTSTQDGRNMQDKLYEMNARWEAVNARAEDVHRGLQVALLQSQEFHHEIHDRYMWLESVETRMQKCEPINLNADQTQLWVQYNKLMELHGELERNQPKILAIKDTTDQLYMNTDSQEMVNAKDKMHIIANRVRALLRHTSSYKSSLEDKLNITAGTSPAIYEMGDVSGRSSRSGSPRAPAMLRPGSTLRMRSRSPFALSRQLLFGDSRLLKPADETDNLTTEREALALRRRRPPLFARVLRTALPLQLLLLLLLGVACLVPICEDEYSCLLANNLQNSLSPMLRYTDGPPPL